ncbi:hypothetical protein B0O80DRAFT_431015 [Mortierella sp. GBAus27b]|nr:hypothetical protein B0O80DRAFT_431015 [Mortierella sp. GBAus27b]
MSRYGDDDSSNFSDSLTASSASDDDRYRSRSGKGSRRRKKRRYSDVLSSDSSSSSEGSSDDGSDSDLLLSRRKLPTSRASVVSDPMSRFNGPLTEMMAQVDSHIQFWDINAQKLMLSVPPRENRVIPYAETLTWVSEDAIVAVSHLKTGSRWPEPSAEPSNAELTTHSAPEAQTNLITIYFNREGQLGFRVLTITTMPHLKPINTVTAVMGEDHSVSYVTGGSDKRLFHWKFGPPDNQSLTGYEPQGLVELHQAHSNSITSTMYSHTSKTLYSGGLDGKYVSFSLEHQKVIREQRLGQVLHIVQNPMDPRINLVAVLSRSRQYLLVDERTPTQTVLNVGYWTQSKISKLSVPSWQPGGGLLCTGASTDGAIYLWDVRWNSIKTEINRRPGKGVVIGDVKYNGAVKSQNHPIFRNQLLQPEVPLRDTPGGPSQILEIPGKKVVQACFHPTKNVMMIINSDCNLTFM